MSLNNNRSVYKLHWTNFARLSRNGVAVSARPSGIGHGLKVNPADGRW